ncbi:MCE family protein [Mycobacteroides chelonae]|nr:MCE family protein [Mycobacteroides chelonae]
MQAHAMTIDLRPKVTALMRVTRRRWSSRSAATVGAVSVAVTIALVAGILMINKAGLGYTRYRAEFAQAAQIQSGDDITVAGVSVGKVTGTSLVGNHVLVGLRIRHDIRVGSGSHANIKVTTLLGSRYVELRPAGDAPLENWTIPLANTGVPYDLQTALADATGTFEQVDADQIGRSVDALSRNLNGLPPLVPQAMENLRELSAVVSSRRDQIGSLLSGTASVTEMLREQQANIGALVNQGQSLFQEIVDRRESLTQLLRAVTKIVDILGSIVMDNRAGLDGVLANLSKVTAMLSQHDDLLRSILQLSPLMIRNATNAFGTGNALDINVPAGPLVDSWMCAISGRAKQFNMIQYYKDCK